MQRNENKIDKYTIFPHFEASFDSLFYLVNNHSNSKNSLSIELHDVEVNNIRERVRTIEVPTSKHYEFEKMVQVWEVRPDKFAVIPLSQFRPNRPDFVIIDVGISETRTFEIPLTDPSNQY